MAGHLSKYHTGEILTMTLAEYTGSVIASSAWGGAVRKMDVPEAIEGSWDALLHRQNPTDKIIFVDQLKNNTSFNQPIGHRAIGVVYNLGNERGNYVPSVLPERYNAFIFIDRTEALHPLGLSVGRKAFVAGCRLHGDCSMHF